ncbi:unnamed protein product [Urochloa decumbens]|uniref:Knottins-like domain-containing protein n=1 Tax=Urochloa decumbens TaxID=240449 RepID=A0ABC9AW37_9POAL
MAAPRKNLSPATTALLLVVIMAAEMLSVDAARISSHLMSGRYYDGTCTHLSGDFHGICWGDGSCSLICKEESSENIRGYCHDFPSRCYCVTACPP